MKTRLLVIVVSLPLLAAAVWFARSVPPPAPAVEPAAPSAPIAHPRAVIAQTTYDLGTMNPGDRRRHAFLVRNDGEADLLLTLGSTSCKCTLAKLNNVRIPPGKTDVVELEWHAQQTQFRFRQGAVINTNDPAMPSLELVGEGSVRVKLATHPESVYLADVPRNTPRNQSVLVYSQAFAEVEIRGITPSSAAFSAVLSDKPPATSPPAADTRLRDLLVTLAPQSKPGKVDGTLRIDYVGRSPDGTEEAGVLELAVSFDVVGDVTVEGRDVAGGVLSFGAVSQATGGAKQAYLHVRGPAADDLRPTVARKRPEFLEVRVGEPQKLSPTITRFCVSVNVPPGVSLQAFTESSLGEVELTTQRDDVPTIRLPVSLVVVP